MDHRDPFWDRLFDHSPLGISAALSNDSSSGFGDRPVRSGNSLAMPLLEEVVAGELVLAGYRRRLRKSGDSRHRLGAFRQFPHRDHRLDNGFRSPVYHPPSVLPDSLAARREAGA